MDFICFIYKETKNTMDKIFELIMLIVLALGSAILFSFAMIWKFAQAIFQLIIGTFRSERY